MENKMLSKFYVRIKASVRVVFSTCLLLASYATHGQANSGQSPISATAGKQSGAATSNQLGVLPKLSLTYTYISPLSEGHDKGVALLPLTINGRLHANFLIDTGTTFSSITDEAVKALGLNPKPALNEDGKPVLTDGEQTSFVIVSSAKTSDGKFDFNGEFVVINRARLAVLPEFKTVDGIIGINMLSQLGILWDFSHHNITIFIPPTLSQQERQSLGFTSPGITLTRTSENQLFYAPLSVTAGLNTAQEQALVDTGSTSSLISASLARQLNLHPMGNPGMMGGALGYRIISASFVTTLRLGGEAIPGPLLHYPVRDAAWPPPQLGVDVLSRFRVLFDFQEHKMYLAPAIPLVLQIQAKP